MTIMSKSPKTVVSMMLPMVMLTLLIIATLFSSNNAYALSQVTAIIDKNPAMINESILLTVTADDDVNRNALDTSPLLSDFIVGQTSVSSQTSMVNFKTSRLTTWKIVLIARNTGELMIPALTIENQQSAPIALTVVAAKEQNNSQTDIFITSELSSNEVYVQQLLTLTIKLHFAIELKAGSLTEPSLTGAAIEKVGQDKQSDNIINGRRYRVIEQTYAITPEQSGEFTLSAPLFSGEVLQGSPRRANFLSFAQTKPVSIVGDELAIKVLPIPANYPNNSQWLPTDILTLHQEWQADDEQFKVGEPITRTITLTAAGLSKSQLPALNMHSSPGLKIYPDQAELHASLRNGRLVSQKVQNFALVPSSAGEFVLPAMTITWFNTITNKIEKATLPAKTITVKAAATTMASGLPNHLPSDSPSNLANTYQANTSQQTVSDTEHLMTKTPAAAPEDKRLQWLFLSLWLLTSLAWVTQYFYRKSNQDKKNKQPLNHTNSVSDTGKNYLTLLAACKKNNAEQALSLLLPWLKQLLGNEQPGVEITTIAQAQDIIQEQSFKQAVNDLQQHLYGKDATDKASSWQGMTLLNAIQTVHKQQHKPVSTSPLSLNP
ncbi:BatD family protein [Colwellia ponticola]|nr:BatD family protein [Colwellia ponticola]